MLKIRIRLTRTRKPRKPGSLILMRPPTATAMTVSTIPAANEINHAGKYDPNTSIDGTCRSGELQLPKEKTATKISSVRIAVGKKLRIKQLAGDFKCG